MEYTCQFCRSSMKRRDLSSSETYVIVHRCRNDECASYIVEHIKQVVIPPRPLAETGRAS